VRKQKEEFLQIMEKLHLYLENLGVLGKKIETTTYTTEKMLS
jgi:mevalonate kinase